ncbi:MAG: hypothetical protein IPP77_06025 [Bacteroidetes bacterium]|nr:hypothetical protein [Bacteroidota bacterium]
MSNAKEIGILFDYSSPENERVVIKFAEELKSRGKQVEIFAFSNNKETVPASGVQLLNKADVNWAQIPEGEVTDSFIRKDFDLLLCCFIQSNPTLEYIARISHAKWRVGIYSPDKTDYYDLMVHLEAGKDLASLIEQIEHFLNQINYDSN